MTLDTVLLVTVLTRDRKRCDEIDRIIDRAFARDFKVQIVRVVGYTEPPEIEHLASATEQTAKPRARRRRKERR